MNYDQNTLPTSGCFTADIQEPPEQPTKQGLIETADYYFELPAWNEYQRTYGKRQTEEIHTILDGLVTTWTNSVLLYKREMTGAFPDEINKISFRKNLRRKTIKAILRTFGQKFHGNDDSLFVLYDQLLKYQERIDLEAEQKRIERNKLAEGERVF